MDNFKELFTEAKLDEGFIKDLIKKFTKEKDAVPTSMSMKEVINLAKKSKATRTHKIPGISGPTIYFDNIEDKKKFIRQLEDGTYNDIGTTAMGPCVIVKFEKEELKKHKNEIYWKGQFPKEKDPYDFD